MADRPAYLAFAISLVIALPACMPEHAVRLRVESAPAADEPGRPRGIIDCETDRPCGAPTGPATRALRASISADDLVIRFLKVGADGQRWPLENGSIMAPGEKFAIRVQSLRNVHVYLWHRDPRGRITELVGASGVLGSRDCARSNRIGAGQTIELPAPGEYYIMDASTGIEHIQPFISPSPLCGSGDPKSGWLRAGARPDCFGASGRCGEVFTIRHLTRT